MRHVSIQTLEANLSSLVAEVESGATVVITRHNAPVAELRPGGSRAVHRGGRVGSGRLEPALKRGTKGRYLAVLLEDRGRRC